LASAGNFHVNNLSKIRIEVILSALFDAIEIILVEMELKRRSDCRLVVGLDTHIKGGIPVFICLGKMGGHGWWAFIKCSALT
jgi:hypothetical protein